MLVEVKVPVLSESVADASLVDWHKKVGEYVKQDENLIELETDKVALEIPAPAEGILKEIRKENGTSVLSSEVIAVIDTDVESVSNEIKTIAEVVTLSNAVGSNTVGSETTKSGVILSPAANKLVLDNNVDTGSLLASGKGGRVTKEDVMRYLSAGHVDSTVVSAVVSENEKSVPVNTPQPVFKDGVKNDVKDVVPPVQDLTQQQVTSEGRGSKRVPMTRLRIRIAERLKQAQNTAAILTTFNEVNMQPVMDLRARYQNQFIKKYDVKLGFMSFFIKASIEALKKFPVINSSIDGSDIIYHEYFDMGIAVSSPRGLVVPVLRDADKQSFAELETSIIKYGRAAKDGSLSMDDLMGGTFTVTNGGVFGSLLSTPILNPPQSAILGMHTIKERPVVEDGEIVVRPIMNLALSYDHRIIDGSEAVLFLVAVKGALEDPTRMLLQI